uniref:Uncharacterized protein n=1 Tax=Timema shepardi TaxID=629360 RepID=A0A7R9B3W3_TIMSH|nr:unnamed protein product [Timema shepardi]
MQVVPNYGMADSIVAAGTVLPNPAGNLLPGPSQGRNIEKRRKRVRPSSPLIEQTQEVVRPQPRFLVMSRTDENENLRRVSPFVLERVISGAAGSGVSIRKLRDGTIMIQTENDFQTSKIMAITEIPLSPSKHIPVKEPSSGKTPETSPGNLPERSLGNHPGPSSGSAPSPPRGNKLRAAALELLILASGPPEFGMNGETEEAVKASPTCALKTDQRKTTEKNSPLKVILSWKFWIPLSRLSYCVYIVHVYVFIVRTGSNKGPKRFDGFDNNRLSNRTNVKLNDFVCRLYGKLHAINNIFCCSLSGNRAAIFQFGKYHTVERLSPNGMANFKIKANNLLSAGPVLQKRGDISLPDPSQGRNNEKRRKRDCTSSLILNVAQEMVKLHRFLVISLVKDGENLKAVSPFILERAISGAAKADDSIRKLRNGTLWYRLIYIQWFNIVAISEIMLSNTAHKRGKVDSYRFFNICEGVVTCYYFGCVNIEEICEELSPQHEVQASFHVLRVQSCVPDLGIVFQCQELGHTKLGCRGKPTCADYGLEAHEILRLHGVALGQCDGRWESGIGNTSSRASVCEERGFSTYTKLLVVRTRVAGIAGQDSSSRSLLDNSGQPISRMVPLMMTLAVHTAFLANLLDTTAIEQKGRWRTYSRKTKTIGINYGDAKNITSGHTLTEVAPTTRTPEETPSGNSPEPPSEIPSSPSQEIPPSHPRGSKPRAAVGGSPTTPPGSPDVGLGGGTGKATEANPIGALKKEP